MFLLVSGRHVDAHLVGHQHGVSIQISINLGNTFLRISSISKIAVPESWRESLHIYLLSFLRFWTSSIERFLFFIMIYFEWRDTENQQSIRVASLKNIKFPRGNYQSDSSETKKLNCFYCSPLISKISSKIKNQKSKISSKIILSFSLVLDKSRYFKKENRQKLQFVVYFLFYIKILRTRIIHLGIFLGRALWTDSVFPRMNTIASRDQFKPIRIGENLVVNHNA